MNQMYVGKTNKIYCPSRMLSQMDLLNDPDLNGTMTYCEHKIEGMHESKF